MKAFQGKHHKLVVSTHPAGCLVHLQYVTESGDAESFPLTEEYLPSEQAERLAEAGETFFMLYNLLRHGGYIASEGSG